MWCGCVAEIGKEDLCHHHFEDITDTCMLEESVGSGGLAYFNFSFLMIDYWLLEGMQNSLYFAFFGSA